MNHTDYYGQLYEAFIEWILEKNTLLQPDDINVEVARADQMTNLIEAEHKGENPEIIRQMGQIIQDKICMALLLLEKNEE